LFKEAGVEDIPVFGGGIIPDQDIPKLKQMGVAEVFQPGTTTSEIIQFLRSKFGGKE
jgi:methylmalonyl-CoA mutase C-terminal domain/subunit